VISTRWTGVDEPESGVGADPAGAGARAASGVAWLQAEAANKGQAKAIASETLERADANMEIL
jgi:hypothetical protein